MGTVGEHLTTGSRPPDAAELAGWMGDIGYRYWTRLAGWIERSYPGVFTPDWQFGGRKHGWSLRYKKSKSFCTLVPEYGRLKVVIVFGAEERARAEPLLPSLSSAVQAAYTEAATFHDGKWVGLIVDSDTALADVERLLAVKRKPKTYINEDVG